MYFDNLNVSITRSQSPSASGESANDQKLCRISGRSDQKKEWMIGNELFCWAGSLSRVNIIGISVKLKNQLLINENNQKIV